MKKLMILSILVIFISGCATKDQQARTEGTAGGAAIGGILGGLIGYALGDESGAVAGAAIGGVLGGAVGYTYADNIANRHAALEGRENDIDARISFAEGINQDTQTYNELLERDIATLGPEIDNLIVQTQKEQISQQQLDEKKQSLDKKVQDSEAALALAKNELDNLKKFQNRTALNSTQQQSDELDTEIEKLTKNLDELRKNTETMAALNQKI